MMGQVLVGALGIGTVLNLLRIAAKSNEKEAATRIARIMQAEALKNEQLSRAHAEAAMSQQQLAQAQLDMAMQSRGIYTMGRPVLAPHIMAARERMR